MATDLSRLRRQQADGKISPEAMMLYYLDEIASRLGDIEQRAVEQNDRLEHIRQEMAKSAVGQTDKMTIAVTDIQRHIPLSEFFSSCQFNNDGASPVYIGVNNVPNKTTPMNAGEQTSIDMRGPKIKDLYFICDTGLTASVRVFLVR